MAGFENLREATQAQQTAKDTVPGHKIKVSILNDFSQPMDFAMELFPSGTQNYSLKTIAKFIKRRFFILF